MKTLRQRLDPLLGTSHFERGRIGHTAVYRFDSEIPPTQSLRLKIEINTREHLSVLGFQPRRLAVESPWFSGAANLVTYHPDELYATKLRALYQRAKGRDLFDLALGLERGLVDPDAAIRCCLAYLKVGKTPITRRQFTNNLKAKIKHPAFRGDIVPLLAPGTAHDPDVAYERVIREFIERWPVK